MCKLLTNITLLFGVDLSGCSSSNILAVTFWFLLFFKINKYHFYVLRNCKFHFIKFKFLKKLKTNLNSFCLFLIKIILKGKLLIIYYPENESYYNICTILWFKSSDFPINLYSVLVFLCFVPTMCYCLCIVCNE